MSKKILFVIPVLACCLFACRPAVPTPKPRGFFRMDFPEKQYVTFDSVGFPLGFQYPGYGTITQDTSLVRMERSPYWINVFFPEFNATIYLSYKAITATDHLDKLVNESYKLSQKHDIRADYIKITDEFVTPEGLTAVYYSVGGNAASSFQFYVTDRERHFTRGALYFDVTPNVDSLRPAIDFLRKDMEKMVMTMRFK
jgi:gliding motility-associated lipoprotein GldD